ncbi:dual oxidase-like [Tachypleus tridentatus]|uniref:dual oxidase-like n=1 Tax=Tachypleus tridentatus TaxID=6853 RepID=UPI003FCF33C1
MKYFNHSQLNIICYLVVVCVFFLSGNIEPGKSTKRVYSERQRYDGWFNNLAHPEWGSVESQLIRKTPPSYLDGVYKLADKGRPSSRTVSQVVFRGDDGLPSERNLTALFAFFGQVVFLETLMASEPGCPIELHKIEIDTCDATFDKDCQGKKYMPYYRARYDTKTGQSPNSPREQVNMVTSWIDGSFVYSTSIAWVNSMRSFKNGTFRQSKDGNYPPKNTERAPLLDFPPPTYFGTQNPERLFLLGNAQTNQNPALLTFGILFFRWHNVLASRIQEEHPEWPDEDVFHRARQWVIASLQNIIMYEFLPALLGEDVAEYTGYNLDVHPGISHVFHSAAFRFGHSLIPLGLYRRDGQCNYRPTEKGYPALRLCSTWWESDVIVPETGIEEILMGLASQLGEREDEVLCSDLRDNLFGPLHFTRRDLGAIDIMSGRDSGVPDYNTVRMVYQLPPISSWTEINPNVFKKRPNLSQELDKLYGSVDKLDLFVGGMLETEPGRPGPLFAKIIMEQFQNIRKADRFWFENERNGIFTSEEVQKIREIHLYDIIINCTDIQPGHIQEHVFTWAEGDPCPQPMQLNSSDLGPCIFVDGYDYFRGSEVAFIFTCIALAFIPIICAGLGYAVIKIQNRIRRRCRTLMVDKRKNGYKRFYVKEWVNQHYKRLVKLKIGPDDTIYAINRKGEILRKVDFKNMKSLVVEISRESRKKPLVLIRCPREHDFVLQFENENLRKKFLHKLETFIHTHNKSLEFIYTPRDTLLTNAETKEKRQSRLEHFFREAYTLAIGLKPGEKMNEETNRDVVAVMRIALSRKEFAEALGMKPDSLFVKLMFNCVDKDKNGRISFQEFLDTVLLISKGKTEDKLRIIFQMFDEDGDGLIDKDEVMKMLRSLVDIAKTKSLTEKQVSDTIAGMFAEAGLDNKQKLDYNDFKAMMSEYRGDLISIGLDFKGAKQNFWNASTNVGRMISFEVSQTYEGPPIWIRQKWNNLVNLLEENRQEIFYLFIFGVVNVVFFIERFLYYTYYAEHTDLRHILGLGISFTRASAASLSFCYSLLLLTMCRNLITKIREHSIRQYIPMDSHVQFHKIVAMTALFFTLIHSIGHLINFYQLSTQPLGHLRCFSKELQFASDFQPTITYWLFQTITGVTAILLVITVCIIFIFAHPLIRLKAYKYFWLTHNLYIVLYILTLMHGLARLTGPPRFWYFFIVPAIVFVLDKVTSLQTKFVELDILETELLPSDVTKIKFTRPPNFKYLSGQWVRVTCTGLRRKEYHSFTLTSAPHENFLSIHVKAQGPWTWKLRNYFDPSNVRSEEMPKIRLEGPFGGGNQDWYEFEVAVMIGGGIGVTPYASILNDLVFGTSTNRYSGVACKKVYFLWICPSHRHFEWFIDVLKDVEKKDITNVLEIHIFITQFFHKFDLRTIMLYICENHFQRISNSSIFTGLKAINHFGRPDMINFLKFIRKKYSHMNKVGVFSCGPTTLTKSITTAIDTVNNARILPRFIHRFENF